MQSTGVSSSVAMRLRWHCPAAGEERGFAALAAALLSEGVDLGSESTHANGDIPGILLLGAPGPENLAQVARLSRGGRRLVVALGDDLAANTQLGWQLLALGASEIVPLSQILAHPEGLATRLDRWRTIDDIVASPLVRENLIGSSPAWVGLLRRVVEVAHFTTSPIMLLGESGTGKELLARLIHTLDTRTDKRELIVVDCTTVAPELSGSEFFGHERGSFTNAHAPRDGAFMLANRGSLFLDEIGELPHALQAQLLRVVQEKTFKRLGSNVWQQTDFRLVCATNRNLEQETQTGSFRRDLYYRLAGWVFRIPNLADRREDILPLAQHFLASICPNIKGSAITPVVAAWLKARAYPGNIRDLRQLVSRIGHRHVGDGPITLADVPEDERPSAPVELPWPDVNFETAVERAVALGMGLREISRVASDVAVRAAMQSHGSIREAARSLGVTDRALQLRRAVRMH